MTHYSMASFRMLSSMTSCEHLQFPALKHTCLAARNEEKRLAELKKRQQYMKPTTQPRLQQQQQQPRRSTEANSTSRPAASAPTSGSSASSSQPRKCFLCSEPGHIVRKSHLVVGGEIPAEVRTAPTSKLSHRMMGQSRGDLNLCSSNLTLHPRTVKVRRCVW